jgi:hypothetical protein
MDEILNDTEKEKVRAFCADEVMKEAVKKVILFELYSNGTLSPGSPPNLQRNSFVGLVMTSDDALKIGQRAMAMAEGLNFLASGFKKLESYSVTIKKVVGDKNPAR